MFFWEYLEILKNIFFYRIPLAACPERFSWIPLKESLLDISLSHEDV